MITGKFFLFSFFCGALHSNIIASKRREFVSNYVILNGGVSKGKTFCSAETRILHEKEKRRTMKTGSERVPRSHTKSEINGCTRSPGLGKTHYRGVIKNTYTYLGVTRRRNSARYLHQLTNQPTNGIWICDERKFNGYQGGKTKLFLQPSAAFTSLQRPTDCDGGRGEASQVF